MGKRSDELLNVSIRRSVNGEVFDGIVEDIEVGKQTKERLYRIRYTDGDLEHLVREEVLDCSFTNDNPKASGEHKTAPSADMSDIVERSTAEKTKKATKGVSRKAVEATPPKTIKDIAKTSATTPSKKPATASSIVKGGTKPPQASIITKKPAGR